jgi:hypothetical protein
MQHHLAIAEGVGAAIVQHHLAQLAAFGATGPRRETPSAASTEGATEVDRGCVIAAITLVRLGADTKLCKADIPARTIRGDSPTLILGP